MSYFPLMREKSLRLDFDFKIIRFNMSYFPLMQEKSLRLDFDFKIIRLT